MDKNDGLRLQEGALVLGVELSEEAAQKLLGLREELLKWNLKVNLTSITGADEVLEKHFLDSLSIAPDVPPGAGVLDVGTGAGFPGLPLGLARPDVSVTMVDSVGRKVAFAKQASALLGLAPRVRATQVRLTGTPGEGGVGLFDVVVARALADLPAWLALAPAYLAPRGRVLAMLADAPQDKELEREGACAALRLSACRRFKLPWSGAPRAIASFERS